MDQPTSQIFTDTTVYGTFWERFGASFIDGLILLIPSLLVSYFTRDMSYYRSGVGWQTYFSTGTLINIVLNWLYCALQESGPNQATVGKKAMGLKVTSIQGDRITFARASGRFFGKYISMLILLIGYLMVFWDPRRQALHDKMADTLVVKR